jgi:hypothetical protein
MDRNEIKTQMLSFLINSLAKLMTPALIKDAIIAGLSFVEMKVIESGPELDDKLILPMIKAIRELLNIEEPE